ncbi:hypothetical protein [Paraburkholderia bannensis]|uniref:hypothetical protein n=1 Tax=Paraburkholderia bannensis TaxID=765414 RepID=UPI0007C4AC6E|nr:hypothetical protein [Paraburkholderia bannensis]
MSNDKVIEEHFAFVSSAYNEGFRVRLMIDGGVRGVAALESLNRDLDKPFGEVALASRALAFALWQDGWPIEWRREDCPGDWRECSPSWEGELCYRVLPKPEELVLPSIDWSHVAAEYRWLVQDGSGSAYLSPKEPAVFDAQGGGWAAFWLVKDATHFSSFKPGKGDWRKLIVQRPEGA